MNPSIHTAQVLPARGVLFLGIVGFHVLLIYAFASGLVVQVTKILVPPEIDVIDVGRPKPPPVVTPRPPPVTLTTAIIDDPLPLPPINLDAGPGAITLPNEPVGPGPVAIAQPPAPPIHLVGRTLLPNTDNYYPASEIRQSHEGSAEVRSCVDVNGQLDGTPIIEASSGRAPLDNAAIRLARDGKYARAMRGDMPVANCYRFRVTFTLH